MPRRDVHGELRPLHWAAHNRRTVAVGQSSTAGCCFAPTRCFPGPGFLFGWSLLLAEWFSLAVFPVAFAQYFVALDPAIDDLGKVLLKAVFIGIILVTNLVGVKAAGRVNDVLTIAKLSPLVLIVLGGLAFVTLQPGRFVSNSIPFFTRDLPAFGKTLLLIFWAYAGFELSTLPTDEVIQPPQTIPRAIVIGILN